MKYVLPLLALLYAYAASAGQTINGFRYEDPVRSESLPMPSVYFSADEGTEIARSARIATARKVTERARLNTAECFGTMRALAEDGKCSATFFAEDAKCEGETPDGCYENKHFRRKLQALGFKTKRHEVPTTDEEDNCSALVVYWCREVRR